MFFVAKTRCLYTDEGTLIKKLHCPLRMRESGLKSDAARPNFFCDHCDKTVHDTRLLSEDEAVELVEKDPDACLAIKADQDNVTIR